MKKLKLIILISCCLGNSFAQIPKDSIKIMQRALCIEHEIWISTNRDSINGLILKKAQLYKQANLFENSYRELNRIKNDSIIVNEVLYELALNCFLRKDFTESYNTILSIADSVISRNKNMANLKLCILNELHMWEECKNLLLFYVKTGKLSHTDVEGLDIYPKYKSPELAFKLSTYFPGLGQIYTGNVGKGFVNIALQTGFACFAWQQYAYTFYFMGTFAGVYPMFRFYSGGRVQSYNLAMEYNEKSENQVKKEYMNAIQKVRF